VPGALAALEATRSGHIGVIGTLGTVRSGAYEAAIRDQHSEAKISSLACPLFVPLAEEGWVDDEISTVVARRYLAQLFEKDPEIDTLVLGCTHYPLLRTVIERVAGELAGRDVKVVDSAMAMARAAQVIRPVSPNGRKGTLNCFASDTSRLDELAPRFLGEDGVSFELVDL
jgi:glutamate racemase